MSVDLHSVAASVTCAMNGPKYSTNVCRPVPNMGMLDIFGNSGRRNIWFSDVPRPIDESTPSTTHQTIREPTRIVDSTNCSRMGTLAYYSNITSNLFEAFFNRKEIDLLLDEAREVYRPLVRRKSLLSTNIIRVCEKQEKQLIAWSSLGRPTRRCRAF